MTTYKRGSWADAGVAIILGLVIGLFAAQLMPAQTHTQPASAQSSDKFDGECTGHETAGRCADKCPNQTDTLLGYDPQTGAAICKAAPTGCPYGDSIPLGAECDKHAPQPSVTPAQPIEAAQFGGK